jgi:hypothetical protein
MEVEKEYLTYKEAARKLNISGSTFHRNLSLCKYNFTKISKGRTTYYLRKEIEKYLFEKAQFLDRYFTSNEVLELFNIAEGTLSYWRNSGKISFIDADSHHPFFSKGAYYNKKETLALKQFIENVQKKLKYYYSDSETAIALNIEKIKLYSIRKRKLKPDDYIFVDNHFFYKKTAIKNLEKEKAVINDLSERYYKTKEVMQILNITKSTFQRWRENGTISQDEYLEYEGNYYYLKERVLEIKELKIDLNEGYYTPAEVCEILKIDEGTLRYWRNTGRFDEGTYFFDRNRYLYNRDYINSFVEKEKDLNESYYTSDQAGALLDCDPKGLYHLRSKGVIKDSEFLFINGKYYYKKEKINELVEEDNLIREEYILFREAAEIINAGEGYFLSLKYAGKLHEPNYLIYKGKNYVKKEFVNNLVSKFPKLYEREQMISKEELVKEEFVTLNEAAMKLGIKSDAFHHLKNKGELKEPDILFHKRKYFIRKEYVESLHKESFINELKQIFLKNKRSLAKNIKNISLNKEVINKMYITFTEAAEQIGLKSKIFHHLIDQGELDQRDFLRYERKYYVKKEYFEKLKNNILNGNIDDPFNFFIDRNSSNHLFQVNYYTLREVLNLLEISQSFFKKWRDNGLIDIEKSVNINGVHYFEKEYIDDVADEWKTFLSEQYTHVEVLELLNTTDGTIRNWKKSNKIPRDSYKKFFSTCYYKKSVIDKIYQKLKEIEDTYVSAAELYEKFGLYQHSLNSWVQAGLIDQEKYSFHNVQYNYEPNYIEDFITNYYEIADLTKCISTTEIAKFINCSVDAINEFIALNGTKKNYSINGDNFISFEDIPIVFEHFNVREISNLLIDKKNQPTLLFYSSTELENGIVGPLIQLAGKDHYLLVREDFCIPNCYELIKNRIQMEEYTLFCFSHLFSYFIKNGLVKTVRKWVKFGEKYERAILYNKKEMDRFILFRQNGISHKEISERLKIGLNAAKKICLKSENFDECYEYPEGYMVNRREYYEFEQKYKTVNIQNFIDDFMSLSFYDQLRERINQINVPSHLYKTVEDFLGFAATRLNMLKGSDRNLYNNTVSLADLFYRIIKSLSVKNLSDLNDEQLVSFAKNEKFSQVYYRILVKFTEWLINNRQCNFNNPLPPIEKERKREDNRANYSPEEYMLYFEYLLDIEKHISMMIKSRDYTSVWIYTATHMNCAFRGVDIMKLPSMNIKALNILGLDFFQDNRLNEAQISIIINQISSLMNSVNYFAEAKKNNSTYVFTVHPLFYESFATALVIANLHRELVINSTDDNEPLLRYGEKIFDEIRNEEVDKEFNRTYKKVINTDPKVLPKFTTRKMNSSFLTYMHHSLVETSGIHPSLATAYLSRWRGHKDKNSIIHYILMNDFDGTYEDACIRLFSRGQFGWVYDSLVKSLKIDENIDQTEKTLLIRNLQNKYELIEIEEVGLSIVMSVKQKENVMNFMLSKSKKELLELSLKIFSGDLPARVEAGSCLVGRENCPTPELDCLHGGCEYYIPNIRILKYIEKEFHAAVKEYLITKYEAKKIKHAQWLKKIMIIVLEAINGLGIDFVESHIDSQKMIEICKKIRLNKWDNVIRKLEKDSVKLIRE